MTIEVIKGVPVPTVKSRASWKDYPFESMGVGDCFTLEAGTFERRKFSVMLNSVGRRLGTKYSTRTEKGTGKLVVQRVL